MAVMRLSQYIELERKPHRGLMALEWLTLAYMALTLLIVLFASTKLGNPQAMVWDRVRLGAITLAMWVVYRLVPCRLTRLLRVVLQLSLLGTWYADTYELNKLFPNLDPVFASLEQGLFGCQPALLFSQHFPQAFFSELMNMAYASYFPIIATTVLFYFFCRYEQFERAAFVVLASFFAFYVIYDLVPVTGPMYYYHAVGVDQVVRGVFPSVGDYFLTHTDMMTSPGWSDGLFYQLVADLHTSGERPTAAFPSSHVGISVVCMLLVWRARNRKLFFTLLPFALLICLATVYIRAHYAVDVIGGLVTGVAFYLLWGRVYDKTC